MDGLKSRLRKMLPVVGANATPMTRRVRDLRSYKRLLSRSQRQGMRAEFDACRTFEQHFHFARKWMHGGAMQLFPEIEAALEAISRIGPGRVGEIGTANCGTTYLLSQVPGTVELTVGLDLYIMNGAYLQWLRRPGQRFHLLNGPSQAPSTVKRVEQILGGELFDVLLIDGDHRYEGVKQDFLSYRHLVRDGGLILFHDIVPDHGTRFGRVTQAWAGDVPVLWSRLKQLYPHEEFIYHPLQNGCGIGMLHYSSQVEVPEPLLNMPLPTAGQDSFERTRTPL